VRKGVMDYERRHGYRGPEGFIELPKDADDREQAIETPSSSIRTTAKSSRRS
jgi:membrane carboxypeptidase/penicillin-binding protein